MAEIRHLDGTVRWRGDDPAECLAASLQLGPDHSIVGFTMEELPQLPDTAENGGEEKRKKAEAKLPKPKLITDRLRETLIVNEATGEIEQRLPGSGKVEIADPENPDKTIEVTPAQLRDYSMARAIDHMREAHEIAIGGADPTADLTQSALASVLREAEEAGERLSPADALARAQEKLSAGDTAPAAVDPPSEIRHEGEPVKFSIEKASG